MEEKSKYTPHSNRKFLAENIDVEAMTAVNPDGFFADLTDSVSLILSDNFQDACSVAVAVRVRPLVGRELTEGNRKECI